MTFDTIRIHVSVLAFAAAIVIGCNGQSKPKWSINDSFQADNEPRAIDAYHNQQTANGARADGTLYAGHFTGGNLNSLGQQKLSAMLYGPERGKVSIYLDVPKDADYASRESSVVTFLSNKGMASNAFEVTPGANPNGGTPAVQGLKGLAKQSGGDAGSSASSDTPAASMSK